MLRIFVITLSALLVLGAGFLGTFYYFTYYPIAQKDTEVTRLPVTSQPVSLTLYLSSPDYDQLVFNPNLLVEGKTSPEAVAIVNLNDDDQMIKASGQGDFSATLILQEGINQLSVTAFDNQGNRKTEDRTVYYSTEKL